jgi:hypothetical protein
LLIELIVRLIDVIAENIPAIAGSLVSVIVAVIESITSNIAVLIEPLVDLFSAIFQGIADVIEPVIKIIVDTVSRFADSISQILSSIADAMGPVSEAIRTALQGLADIFDSVFTGIATVIESVGSSIKSVLDGIAGVIDSIGEAALNAGTGFESLANGVKIITNLKLTDMAASLAAVATGIANIAAHSGDIAKVGDGLNSIKAILVEVTASFANAGITMIASMTAGFQSAASGMYVVVTSVMTQTVATIKGSYRDYKRAGGYVVDGFASGIDERTWRAEAKSRAMARAALEAAKDELDENSPSKEFYDVGAFAGQGFVNAFIDYESVAFGAGSRIARAATNGLNRTVSRLSDIIDSDIDVQPVIRPVLDLSAVRSGANAIGGMLGFSAPVTALAAAGSVSAAMNSRGQNGGNGDVVSAINRLGGRLGNAGNTYNYVNGVTYDDGSNIANAVEEIIREAIRERRV